MFLKSMSPKIVFIVLAKVADALASPMGMRRHLYEPEQTTNLV